MNKFSELDLGSTILSIAVAAGFIACGFVILRLLTSGLKYIITKFNFKSEQNPIKYQKKENKKGF